MRTILSVTFALAMIFIFTACGNEPITNAPGNKQPVVPVDQTEDSGQNSINEKESVEGAMIKLILDNEEIIVSMYDNPTSRDFVSMLPLTLSFEEFAGKEKISYLSRKLSTESAPLNGPSVGDFAYYSPWGNLAIFYKDPGTAGNGLIVLGEIKSGKEHLANVRENFTLTIERMD